MSDNVYNELQIDTMNGSMLSEKRANQLEPAVSPIIKRDFQQKEQRSREIQGAALGYIING